MTTSIILLIVSLSVCAIQIIEALIDDMELNTEKITIKK